jgi:formate dehydrogenase subunit delta
VTNGADVDAPEALVRMANQIAANYRYLPEAEVEAAVANHLRSFWAPSMRAELTAWIDETGGPGLEPEVRAAARRL